MGRPAGFPTNTTPVESWFEARRSDPINPSELASWGPIEGDNVSDVVRNIRSVEARYRQEMVNLGLESKLDDYTMRFDLLPYDTRRELSEMYDRYTGARKLIQERGIGRPLGRRDPGARTASRPFFSMPVDIDPTQGPVDIGAVYFARQNFQISPERALYGADIDAIRSSGGRRLTLRGLADIADQINNTMNTVDKNILFFDIETAGLRDKDGLVQLAARLQRSDGDVSSREWYFKNDRFNTGVSAVDGGTAVSLEEAQRRRIGAPFQVPRVASGDDYASKLLEFFSMVDEADIVSGQNIRNFDFPALVANAKDTAVYHATSPEGEAFRAAVGRFETKFSRLMADREVVDTLEMFRVLFSGKIDIDPELERMGALTGRYSTVSIQNILLQTNMLNLMEEELGPEEVANLIAKQHEAAADVVFSQHLHKEMEGVLRGENRLRFGGESIRDSWRRTILKGGALVPTASISDISEVDSRLVSRLESAGLIRDGQVGISYMEQNILLGRQATQSGLSSTQMGPAQMAIRANMWREYSSFKGVGEGFITKAGELAKIGKIPSNEEYAAVQKRMADAGIPFSGHHWIERHLSNVMGTSRGFGLTSGEGAMRNVFGGLTGLGVFEETGSVRMWGGRLSVPLEVMREAEEYGVFGDSTAFRNPSEKLQKLYFDTYTTTKGKEKRVSLVADVFSRNAEERAFQAEMMQEFLIEKRGMARSEAASLAQVMKEYGSRYGIQVGQARGGAAEHLFDALTDISGGDFQDDTTRMFTSLVDSPTGQAGQIYTSQVMSDRLIDDSRSKYVLRENETVLDLYRRAFEMRQGRLVSTVDRMISANPDKAGERFIGNAFKVMQAYDTHKPTVGKALLGAVAATASYYGYRRYRNNQLYDAALDTQDIEDGAAEQEYMQQMRYDLIPPKTQAQRRDALHTAHIPGMLDANSVRHTKMGSNRYSHLFGGGYN